nr:phosphate transporter PHO1 [Ipomoea batatas]
MVKFSKELEAQLIPEWKDAFLNYWQLKKLIKKIKVARERKHVQAQNSHAALSIFDPMRALVNKISDKFQRCSVENPDDERIQVTGNGNEDGSGSGEEETYDEPENELAQLFSEEDEVKRFFAKLDAELEKVNEFYKMKEGEFVERGEILNNQLEVLFDLKQVLNDRRKGLPFSSPSSNLYNDNNIDFSG